MVLLFFSDLHCEIIKYCFLHEFSSYSRLRLSHHLTTNEASINWMVKSPFLFLFLIILDFEKSLFLGINAADFFGFFCGKRFEIKRGIAVFLE